MTNKKDALQALQPFIRYFLNIGKFRQAGFSAFMISGAQSPNHIIDALAQPGTLYGLLFDSNKKPPIALLGFLVVIIFGLASMKLITGVNYFLYVFAFVVAVCTGLAILTVRAFSIARAGLMVQFRIPENYYAVETLMNANFGTMILSEKTEVRYAAFAFRSLSSGHFDAFKMILILNGLFAHFNISGEDIKTITTDDDALEKILIEDSKEY